MNQVDRLGTLTLAMVAMLVAQPASAQTIIIDGSGARSEGTSLSGSGGVFSTIPRAGSPARTILPYNTPGGPVLAGQDTSLPPRQFSSQDRIILRPPGQSRTVLNKPAPAARPVVKAPAVQVVKPAPQRVQPKPVARAEPVRPAATAPKSAATPRPAPAAAAAAAETPKAPAVVESPAATATRPVSTAPVTPAPVQTPRPVPVARPEPAATPQVAAVTPPAAVPNLSRISFDAADTEVSAAGRATLEQVAANARDDRNLRIQVKAFADSATETDVWKRRVSLRRAQNVRRILLDNGIESFRILVRALGAPAPDDSAPGNRVDIEIGRR